MTGVHIYIRKHITSHRIVSRRPRYSIDASNDEQAVTVRVPSPVTLVPLDELHPVLHCQQATKDSHLSDGNLSRLPADAESEQSVIPEEDDEVTQKSGAIKVPHPESTEQKPLSTGAAVELPIDLTAEPSSGLAGTHTDVASIQANTPDIHVEIPGESLLTAGQQTGNDDFHHQSSGQSSRLLGIVVLTTRIVIAIIIVLFFLVFPRIVLPKGTLHAAPQLSAGVVATATVAVATPTPFPIPGLTITPDHFNATTGCTFAQGRYRCIITLTLSKNHHNTLKWSISRSGLTATFSPSKGRVQPGHPQQIVISIYNDCPHSGSLIFSVGGKTIPIPWSC
jgi:hypothetical protein